MRKLSKEPSMEIYHASQNITPYPANESEWDSFKKLTRKIWFMKMGHVLSPFYNQIWVLLREFFTSLIWPEHKGNPNWVDLAKWWIDLGLPNSLRRYPAEPVGCLLFFGLLFARKLLVGGKSSSVGDFFWVWLSERWSSWRLKYRSWQSQ